MDDQDQAADRDYDYELEQEQALGQEGRSGKYRSRVVDLRVETRNGANQGGDVTRVCLCLTGFLLGIAGGCGQPPTAPEAAKTPPPAAAAAPTPSTVSTTATPDRSAARPADTEPHYHLDHAQTRLPTVTLHLGARSLEAELCTTLQQVATGLMFRRGIGTNDAMLFVFGSGDRRSFYMKNVDFDINAAYIDGDGIIQEIVTLKKQEVTPVPSKSTAIQFVLETAPDWFTRNGIGVGTLIRIEQGGLKETLGPRAQLR